MLTKKSMPKKMQLISSFLLLLVLSTLLYPETTGKGAWAAMEGIFVEATQYADRTTYDAFLDDMRFIGVDTIIFTTVGSISCDSTCRIQDLVDDNQLKWLVEDATNRSLDVYVGLYQNSAKVPWRGGTLLLDTTIVNDVLEAEKILALFSGNPRFKGFYLPQETDAGFENPAIVNRFYIPVISLIHAITSKPVIAGGYIDPFRNGLLKNPAALTDWVKRFIYGGSGFKGNSVDYFILQDGVGAFDTPLVNPRGGYNLETYIAAARAGVTAVTPSKEFWTVTELFQWSENNSETDEGNTWYRPSNITLVNDQLYVEGKYATKQIGWMGQHSMNNGHGTPDYRGQSYASAAQNLFRGFHALEFGAYEAGKWYSRPVYSYSRTPDSPYLDQNFTKLTDGIIGQERWFTWELSEWVGWSQPANSTVSIIVDLGQNDQPVSNVTVVAMTKTTAGISFPWEMKVWVSNDNKSFTQYLGNFYNRPDDPIYLDNPTYRRANFYVNGSTARGRYVKIELTSGGQWLFLTELEVYSNVD